MNLAGDPPRVTIIGLDAFQPGSLEGALQGGKLDHVQIGKGRFRGMLLTAALGESCLDFGAYNVPLLAVGPMPADRVTLGFVSSNKGCGVINGLRIEQPSAVFLGENSELHYRLAPGTRWAALQVAREMLERLELAVPPGHILKPDVDPDRQQTIYRTLDAAVAALADVQAGSPAVPQPDALMLSIQESLISAFAAVMEGEPPPMLQQGPPSARSFRLVRCAEEYLRANFAHPVKITELCDATCSSLRTLERAFIVVHGVTPKRFLTLLRLNEARCRMLRWSHENHSVASIAAAAGFTHLGRFSVEYRRHFGESPLATLRGT